MRHRPGGHTAFPVYLDPINAETLHGQINPLWIFDNGGNITAFSPIYPAHTERERHTKGSSEFTLRIQPKNHGVVLRRTLDYAFPNQRAEVSVADASGKVDEAKLQWRPAGIWYLAGSNSCIYSNPKEELGATQHNVQTSNRRFRDDEFLLPRDLTEGRQKIRVRIRFTPVDTPLFPGHPLPELAWSEIRYCAYCFVMPKSGPGGSWSPLRLLGR